jgi:hypothetical protein
MAVSSLMVEEVGGLSVLTTTVAGMGYRPFRLISECIARA